MLIKFRQLSILVLHFSLISSPPSFIFSLAYFLSGFSPNENLLSGFSAMDDSQWDALRLLANVAVSAWESETEKTKNNSPLFLEEPKVRKLIFKLCNKKGREKD